MADGARSRTIAAFTALLCATLATGVARAENPHLRRAKAQKMTLDYEPALESLRLALELGTSDRHTLAEIYRLAGEIQAGLGRKEAATESFTRLLALDPKAALPEGASPKLAAPFAAAREFFRDRRPLAIAHQIVAGPSPAAVVIVESDPLGMVAGAAAKYRLPNGKSATPRARGKKRIQITLPPADELALFLWVFDAHGNRLASIGSDVHPLRVHNPRTRVPDPPRGGRRTRPFYARWYTWAATAAVSAAVGTYFGLEVLEAKREIDDLNDAPGEFSETKPIARRGRRAALIANISFGAAAGAAIVAAALLLRRDKPRRGSKPRAAVAPMITPGGAGVFVSTDF